MNCLVKVQHETTSHDTISTCTQMQIGQVCISPDQMGIFVDSGPNLPLSHGKTVDVELVHAEIVESDTIRYCWDWFWHAATLCQLQLLVPETFSRLENHELFGHAGRNRAKTQHARQFQISNACLSCLHSTELASWHDLRIMNLGNRWWHAHKHTVEKHGKATNCPENVDKYEQSHAHGFWFIPEFLGFLCASLDLACILLVEKVDRLIFQYVSTRHSCMTRSAPPLAPSNIVRLCCFIRFIVDRFVAYGDSFALLNHVLILLDQQSVRFICCTHKLNDSSQPKMQTSAIQSQIYSNDLFIRN